MPKAQRTRFAEHYESVEDIDLFSGGISELPLIDGVVGPTFACIMGVQFNHLKFGDRFFFEHGNQDGSFTAAQLQSIRRTLFSKIICENGDNFDKIHAKVFLLNSDRQVISFLKANCTIYANRAHLLLFSSCVRASRSPELELQNCANLPDVDLLPWKE